MPFILCFLPPCLHPSSKSLHFSLPLSSYLSLPPPLSSSLFSGIPFFPGLHYVACWLIVDQTGIDLSATLPSLPPKCQDSRYGPPFQVQEMRLLLFLPSHSLESKQQLISLGPLGKDELCGRGHALPLVGKVSCSFHL